MTYIINKAPKRYLRFRLPQDMNLILDVDSYPNSDIDGWDSHYSKMISAREDLNSIMSELGGKGVYEKCVLTPSNLYGLSPMKEIKVLRLSLEEGKWIGQVIKVDGGVLKTLVIKGQEVIKKVIDY